MAKSTLFNIVLALSGVIAVPLAGCGGDPSGPQERLAAGSVSLPLITVANGHTYRLKDAVIYISGPTFALLQSSDDPAETMLRTTLPTGSYVASLQQWTLERDDGTGAFSPVRATLTSGNAVVFSVFGGSTSTIAYGFETDGTIVVVGSGDLRVLVTVDEIPPPCTPFGTDCPPGSWCPPTGLTGAPLACIPEGRVPVGEPCQSPTDCVRDATCIDRAIAILCTAICSSADVGGACASGGICQPGGVGYGICRL